MLTTASQARIEGEPRGGVARIAAEFKALNDRRRGQGLAGRDLDRYYTLFAQLSEALAGVERRRRMDARQFLRVPGDATLVLQAAGGERTAGCPDFGGGGCAIEYDEALNDGDLVQLEALVISGRRQALLVRAEVVWRRPARDGRHTLGLRFFMDSGAERDAVDRALYRVLDAYLNDPSPQRETP